MKKMNLNQILEIIRNNDQFVITAHKSPDGDAIGSALALGLALKKIGKKVSYHLEQSMDKFRFIEETQKAIPIDKEQHFQIGFFLDTSDRDHLHDRTLMERCDQVVNIDHHISNELYGDVNYVDPKASSAGEIIYDIIDGLSVELDREIALCLFTSITSDTGNFKYSNVTGKTHTIAAQLYRFNTDYASITRKLFDEMTYEKTQLIAKALGNLVLKKNGKLGLNCLSKSELDQFSSSMDMEGVINFARDVEGVEVALLIRETDPKTFKVSLRSNTDFDVSKVALAFDGGGHKKAAGCTLKDSDVITVQEKLLKKIDL